jgi:hypothetical protein
MYPVLFYTVVLIGCAPLFLAKFGGNFQLSADRGIVPFLWLVFLSGIYELVFSWILQVNSDIYFRVYLLLEFCAIFYFGWNLLKDKFRLILLGIGLIFISLNIYFLVYWKSYQSGDPDSALTIFETIFVYMLTVCWFKSIFEERKIVSLFRLPAFYFISGFLLYFSGTLFLFLSGKILDQVSGNHFQDFWCLNVFFGILLRLFLIAGIWMEKHKFTRYFG